MNNDTVSTHLGWTANDVATRMSQRETGWLIWGSRVDGMPAPRIADLERTVQGRRLLVAADPHQE